MNGELLRYFNINLGITLRLSTLSLTLHFAVYAMIANPADKWCWS